MEGFLICFIFKVIGSIFKGILGLFEKVLGKAMIRKFKNDDKLIAECEAHYGGSRDFFGEEY